MATTYNTTITDTNDAIPAQITSAVTSAVDALKTRATTLEGEIASLKTRVATLEA